MSNPKYEILIPSHPKDQNKLPYVIERAIKYTEAVHIHVVVPDPGTVAHIASPMVTIHADDDVASFDKSKIKFRSGWVYQQFIKLFQQVTGTDWYLCFCSDLILNKPYPVWRDGAPVMVVGRDPWNIMSQYIEFNKKMLGIAHVAPYNFISDGPFYCRTLIEEMLSDNGYTIGSFMDKSAQIIEYGCAPGDAELYASWVYHKYPSKYYVAFLKNWMNGKYESAGMLWEPKEIKDIMTSAEGNPDVDTISIHSWGL